MKNIISLYLMLFLLTSCSFKKIDSGQEQNSKQKRQLSLDQAVDDADFEWVITEEAGACNGNSRTYTEVASGCKNSASGENVNLDLCAFLAPPVLHARTVVNDPECQGGGTLPKVKIEYLPEGANPVNIPSQGSIFLGFNDRAPPSGSITNRVKHFRITNIGEANLVVDRIKESEGTFMLALAFANQDPKTPATQAQIGDFSLVSGIIPILSPGQNATFNISFDALPSGVTLSPDIFIEVHSNDHTYEGFHALSPTHTRCNPTALGNNQAGVAIFNQYVIDAIHQCPGHVVNPEQSLEIVDLIQSTTGGLASDVLTGMNMAVANSSGQMYYRASFESKANNSIECVSPEKINQIKNLATTYSDFSAPIPRVPVDCAALPTDCVVNSVCVEGCYAGSEMLSFSNKTEKISIANDTGLSVYSKVKTLSQGATLENLEEANTSIEYFIADPVKRSQEIIYIRTKSGLSIEVTPTHVLVDENGEFIRANNVQVGSFLMKRDGDADEVKSVTHSTENLKVYNLGVDSNINENNILFAQGLMSGSHQIQIRETLPMNRIIQNRLELPDDLFDVKKVSK